MDDMGRADRKCDELVHQITAVGRLENSDHKYTKTGTTSVRFKTFVYYNENMQTSSVCWLVYLCNTDFSLNNKIIKYENKLQTSKLSEN